MKISRNMAACFLPGKLYHPASITPWLQLLSVTVLLLSSLHCQPVKALGKNPSGEALAKIEALPNYRNGSFQNLEQMPARDTGTKRKPLKWTNLLKYFVSKPALTRPTGRLPNVTTDLRAYYPTPTVIWFGHSSFLLKTATATILVDPSFSGFAGPLPGLVKAFDGANIYNTADMPKIDVLLISHDHYDHLDYRTVQSLRKKVGRVVVPVGVGSHFIKWGYDPQRITELNWFDSTVINSQLKIIATPAHHRSNRTMAQRKTLWASYVIKADDYAIYFSGDTGYSKHFKLIGNQYGPFDLALLECGQYNSKWPQSHMFPYQTAQAAVDLKAAVSIPVHWAKFAESEHVWNEPVKLLLPKADSLGLSISVPPIGQPYSIGQAPMRFNWWDY